MSFSTDRRSRRRVSTLHRHEYGALISHWAKLDRRHGRSSVDDALDLYVHDRDTAGQFVVLDANIGGYPTFVAKAASDDLGHALNTVRDEMIRQLRAAKEKTEPRHNKRLRNSGRSRSA